MNRTARTTAVFAVLVSFATGFPHATRAENIQTHVTVDIRIAPDRSVTETLHQEITPLIEGQVRAAAQARWAVPGNQSFEVVEAFTRKADGQVIPADPDEFITQDGVIGDAMSFTDIKIHQIPFRDLSVGDTAVATIRMIEKEHYLPGQYSGAMTLGASSASRTLDVTLSAPADLEIAHDKRWFSYREVKAGNDVVRHWSGKADRAPPQESGLADPANLIPGFEFSTFPSFEAIAAAYYDGAKSKLAVTPEIARLATEITAGKEDDRAKAQAIFDWVSRNIRYVAVFFGRGRYVPNDTHTILSRRFGDCKDQATLLSALLAAKGIASEQVLINISNAYQLPKTPVLGAFNHIIVYVPSLDRYLDPTVAVGTFDHLPSQDLGKPVVRVSDQGAKLARTPTIGIEDNQLVLDTRVAMTRTGPQGGETSIEGRGEFADLLRLFAARVEANGKDVELAKLAKLRGLTDSFALEAPSWTQRREPVRLVKWEAQQRANSVQAGWRAPPPFSPLVPHPNLFFSGIEPHERAYPATCRAGRIVHTLDLALSEGFAPGPLPSPIEQRAPQFSFHEEWSTDGNHVRVRTEIVSSVSGRVCMPDQINAIRKAYAAIEQRTNPVLTLVAEPHAWPQAGRSTAEQSTPDASVMQPNTPGSSPAQSPRSGTAIIPNKIETTRIAPKQNSGKASTPIPTLTRAVPAEHKLQVDFFYSINPDCSVIGLANVRVLEQPHDGEVVVENGTGFPNFPPNNQRYECNKVKSDGVAVVYEPRPGFTGADSIMLDVIFPSGVEIKRRYSIAVK